MEISIMIASKGLNCPGTVALDNFRLIPANGLHQFRYVLLHSDS